VAVAKQNKSANRTSVKVHVMRLASCPSGAKFVELKVDAYGKSYVSIFEIGKLAELDGKVLFDWVADQGAPIFTHKKRAQLFQKLVGALTKLLNNEGRAPTKPTKPTIALAADRHGWTSGHFISRYGVHSPPGREVLLSPNLAMADNRHFGNVSFKRVQKFYRTYGRNNPLVRFCLSLAFAGPLLEILERADQPWFVLIGRAGTGKTHLLHAVASPWGGDVGGILGYLSSFSGTLNSIEKLSVAAPDSLLALDDMQALTAATRDRAQILRDAIFRTATGRERGRFGAVQRDWRTISIFGSNDGMNKVMADGTQDYDEPMQGRLIELHCQQMYGILSFVPDRTTPSRFVQAMKSEAVAIRGVAGERFLKHLVRERAQGIEKLRRKLRGWINELHDELGDDGFDGQTSRVVDVFALVYAASCLASQYDILPWSKESQLKTVKTVFADYDRRRRGDVERLDAKRVLSNYIEKRRGDFLVVDRGRVAPDRKALAQAAGVDYRAPDGKRQYCFTPEQFGEIFAGPLQVSNAIRQLRSSGVLMVDGNDASSVKLRPKRKLVVDSRVRVYCIDRLLLAMKGTRDTGKSVVA
jgi:hypothetical protein